MISYGKQTIDGADLDAALNVLKSDWLTQGPSVKQFECDLNNFFNSKYSCAVANGTAALHLAGKCLNWSTDDIILTTPISFLATANCIEYANGITDFVDIDKKSYTIDANLLEEKIKTYRKKGKNIKAVIGVDFAGHPCV